MITREQLLTLGWSVDAVRHRVEVGRLHTIWPGVYSVGRPSVSRYGRWMAATLRTGGVLSHQTAGMLWSITPYLPSDIHVSVLRGHPETGINVHRRKTFERTQSHRIPVTTPVQTLVDIAPSTPRDDLEQAAQRSRQAPLRRS